MAMSDEHKDALAQGRREARAIKAYLDALTSRKPGRPVTAESLKERLARLSEKIDREPNALRRVDLVQQRLNVEDSMAALDDRVDFPGLEQAFVGAVSGYSARKEISYSAWREAGVSAEVLKTAGVPRTRRG